MTNTSKTIVFFGNERLVSGLPRTDTPLLNGLIERGYTVAAIVTHHSESVSRSKRPLEVAEAAAQHSIPIFYPNKPIDIIDHLRSLNAEAGVLSAYGRIIPQTLIDIFPKGIINLHPSLLPKYRGPTPIESAILNGEKETGVSVMALSAGMDSGAVYAQLTTPISTTDTKFDLYHTLSTQGAALILDALPSILSGNLHPTPQDETKATYCSLLQKQDAYINPMNITAVEAERHIRAHLLFPKTKITIQDGRIIIITKAHTSDQPQSPIDPQCSDGVYLNIDELIAPSGRTMSAQAFTNGMRAA